MKKNLLKNIKRKQKKQKKKCDKFLNQSAKLKKKQQKSGLKLDIDTMEIKVIEKKSEEWCARYDSLKKAFLKSATLKKSEEETNMVFYPLNFVFAPPCGNW